MEEWEIGGVEEWVIGGFQFFGNVAKLRILL